MSLPAPALDRAALLEAVARAASAHAAGSDDSDAQAALDGRRFAIRLRFGCAGPTGEASTDALRWRVKSDASLEITATPDLSLDAPQLAGALTQTVEAVEGFWIERPWLLSDACPAPLGDANATPTAPDHSIGIAQYYTAEGSRTERRSGRAYTSIAPIEAGAPLPPRRFLPAPRRPVAPVARREDDPLCNSRRRGATGVHRFNSPRPGGVHQARRWRGDRRMDSLSRRNGTARCGLINRQPDKEKSWAATSRWVLER